MTPTREEVLAIVVHPPDSIKTDQANKAQVRNRRYVAGGRAFDLLPAPLSVESIRRLAEVLGHRDTGLVVANGAIEMPGDDVVAEDVQANRVVAERLYDRFEGHHRRPPVPRTPFVLGDETSVLSGRSGFSAVFGPGTDADHLAREVADGVRAPSGPLHLRHRFEDDPRPTTGTVDLDHPARPMSRLVEPEPRKRPRSSRHRFEVSASNELWQAVGMTT